MVNVLSARKPALMISQPSSNHRDSNCIPVYLIKEASARPPGPAFCLPGIRGVFLDDESLTKLVSLWAEMRVEPTVFSKSPSMDASDFWLAQQMRSDGFIVAEPRCLVAFLLLHEAGHLRNGDVSGLFVPESIEKEGDPRKTTPPSTALSFNNVAKARELRADQYVYAILRGAIESGSVARGRVGTNIVGSLKVVRLHLSEAAHRWRRGGPDSLFSRLSFGDLHATHPSLEYRLALLVYAVERTPLNRSAVRVFLDARRQRWGLLRSVVGEEQRVHLEKEISDRLDKDLQELEAALDANVMLSP